MRVKEGMSVWQFLWQLFVSELVGTAALVLVGVSEVFLNPHPRCDPRLQSPCEAN